jgi:hypothetical protein
MAGAMEHEDFSAADTVGNGNAPQNLFSLLQPLGHAGEIAETRRLSNSCCKLKNPH